jgi:hypothetical protein
MTETEVVVHMFSSGAVVSWHCGCVRLPSLRVDEHGVDLRG